MVFLIGGKIILFHILKIFSLNLIAFSFHRLRFTYGSYYFDSKLQTPNGRNYNFLTIIINY